MRFQRLVVGFLGAALLGAVPVTLTSSPATAGATTQSRLVLDRQANSVYRYGQGVKVSGQIQATCSPGPWCFVDAPGDSVQLYRRVNGASTWKSLGTQYGDANGRFDFRSKSVGTAAYKVVYSGNVEYGVPAVTSVRTIKGSRHPHSRGVKSGGRLYYRGNVDPGWGHKPVTIQKKNCKSCGWHGYKTVRTSRTGAYSARIYAPSRGRWYFRSIVRATAPQFVKATGGTIFTYRARTASRAHIGG